MKQLALASLACVFLACASTAAPTPPDSAASLEWASVGAEETARVVTVDADGALRETTVWIVVVDGSGYLRTSGSSWFGNLERDPDLVLRIGGAAHALRAERVSDPALAARIHAAFREKYGFSDRMIGWIGLRGGNLLRLVARPAS
jgi:hypothetical protein